MNLVIIAIVVAYFKAVCVSIKEMYAKMKHALAMEIVLISITSRNAYALVHMKEKVVKR